MKIVKIDLVVMFKKCSEKSSEPTRIGRVGLFRFFFFFYTFRFFLQLLKRVDLEKVDGGFFLLDRKDITTTLLLSINRV